MRLLGGKEKDKGAPAARAQRPEGGGNTDGEVELAIPATPMRAAPESAHPEEPDAQQPGEPPLQAAQQHMAIPDSAQAVERISHEHMHSTVPRILVEKPLPERPRRSLTPPPPRPRPAGHLSSQDTRQAGKDDESTRVVRRAKSHGQLVVSPSLAAVGTPGTSESSAAAEQRHSLAWRTEAHRGGDASGPQSAQEGSSYAIKQAAVPTSLGAAPDRPRLLTKRASSLGFGRRPSSTALKGASAATPAPEEAVDENGGPVSGQRTASSATAPASTVATGLGISHGHEGTPGSGSIPAAGTGTDRKRKGSGFSFFPAFFRSSNKAGRDTSPGRDGPALRGAPVSVPQAEGDVSPLTEVAPSKLSKPSSSEGSAGSRTPVLRTPELEDQERPAPEEAAPTMQSSASSVPPASTPASSLAPVLPASSRRYSIFPAFFRSGSSSSSSKPAAASNNEADVSPLSEGIAVTSLAPPDPPSPLPIPERASPSRTSVDVNGLPQLPSIERNLGDITFSSLFDFGSKGKRSRASTKSSIGSFATSSSFGKSTPPSAPGPFGMSPALVRGSSNDGASDGNSMKSRRGSTTSRPATPVGLLDRARTITRANHAAGDDNPLRSPNIQTVVTLERERTQTKSRPHRSNSASSGVPARPGFGNLASTSSLDLQRRPTFVRSRSSSTATTHSLTRTLQAHSTLKPGAPSPAITVTQQPAFFDDAMQGEVPLEQASSPVAPSGLRLSFSGIALPSSDRTAGSSDYSSSTSNGTPVTSTPDTPDVNIEDAMSDFISSPALAAMRFSNDSGAPSSTSSVSVSSFSGQSFLSSSPTNSIVSRSDTGARPASLIQKHLRRRANTAGSLLSSSTPASASGSAPSPADVTATGVLSSSSSAAGSPVIARSSVLASRQTRSNSSSRLSSFFTSAPIDRAAAQQAAQKDTNRGTVSWYSAFEAPLSAPSRAAANGPPDTGRSSPPVLSVSPGLSSASSPGAREAWPASSAASSSTSPFFSMSSPRGSIAHLEAGLPVAQKPASSQGSLASPSPPPTASSASASTPVTASARLRSGSALSKSSSLMHIDEDEPVLLYVDRLKERVKRSEIATILASSGDEFHLAALRAYLTAFDFTNDPIDVALRKLLLGLNLPKETQQIDRVMEAFAFRYNECNPALFTTSDQPYILAFSMIMLHTDAFNRAAKTKMSRPDYVKNTRIDGISPDLLEYIYDNIVYAPFVYAADDDGDTLAHRSLSETSMASSGVATASSRDKGKIDVYALIASGDMSRLRIDIQMQIPVKNPFSYTGTVAFFDCTAIHNAFTYAHRLELSQLERRPSETSDLPSAGDPNTQSVEMPITKVGILERKDDLLEGGKKASSRKWKACTVILSGAQVFLLRDPGIALTLQEQIFERTGTVSPPQSNEQTVRLPPLPSFKPDHIISLNDAVALFDFTYSKYTNVFRLLQPNGRETLFRAEDECSLNGWISTINYGASFRTAGIRMRGSSQTGNDATGAPRTFGNRQQTPLPSQAGIGSLPEPHRGDNSLAKMSSATSILASSSLGSIQPTTANGAMNGTGLAPSLPPDLQEYVSESLIFTRNTTSNLQRLNSHASRYGSRSDVVRAKIIDFEAMIKTRQTDLAADLRTVRNLAILTPFTSASRARVQQAVQPVAKRIRTTRQTIARLICSRECLCRDLLASERGTLRERQQQQQQNSQASFPLASHATPDSYRESQARASSYYGSGTNGLSGADATNGAISHRHLSRSLARSASQDELARMSRSPSVLKRSLTSTSEQAEELSLLAQREQEQQQRNALRQAAYRRDAPGSESSELLAVPPQFSPSMPSSIATSAAAPSPLPSQLVNHSPVLATSPFETVMEETEPATEGPKQHLAVQV